MRFERLSVAAALVVVAGGVGVGAAWGQVVYSQPQAVGSAGISRVSPGGSFTFANRRLADSFTLGLPGTVNRVRFWGGTESDAQGATNLTNIRGFNISFFADNMGNVGQLLSSTNVTLAQTSPTQVPGQTVGLLGAAMFRFEAALPTGVELPATRAWVSVAADLVTPPSFTAEAWQWARSLTGDDLIAQDRFDGQGFLPRTLAIRNLGFELEGVLVPAPGSAGVLVLAGVLAARRRRC